MDYHKGNTARDLDSLGVYPDEKNLKKILIQPTFKDYMFYWMPNQLRIIKITSNYLKLFN